MKTPTKTYELINESHHLHPSKWTAHQRVTRNISTGRPEFEASCNMKMVGILLWVTRVLLSTEKEVIMESGFCVHKGLLEIRKRGIYRSALIKERLYWPRGVHRDAINY